MKDCGKFYGKMADFSIFHRSYVIEYCSTKPNYNESTFELKKTLPALLLE